MRMRWLLTACLALGALLLPSAVTPAGAKNFGPGDLRLCSGDWCAPIYDRGVVNALSSFYYGGPQPVEVRAPHMRAPYFQLRFSNGQITGVAAGARLDRFRSGSAMPLGRFGPDRWYRVPARAAAGLRALAAGLKPLRVSDFTLAPKLYR